MSTIRSFNMQLYTTRLNKVALCSRDDKRYNLPHDVAATLAFGHYSIPRIEEENHHQSIINDNTTFL